MIEQYLAGDTRQFTLVCSVAPDSAPWLAIYGPNSHFVLVQSITSTQSGPTAFYAMVTMPSSADGSYKAIWTATKTIAGSAYPFLSDRLFSVVDPRKGAL